MIKLVCRQLKRTWVVQSVLVFLFASTVVMFMLYNAHIVRESSAVGNRIEGGLPEGLYIANVPLPEPVPAMPWSGYMDLLAAWTDKTLPSNLGSIPCAVFTEDQSAASLASPGSAVIPQAFAERFGLNIGDEIALLGLKVRVTEIHDGSPFGLGYNFNNRVLVFTGEKNDSMSFLYRPTATRQYPVNSYIRILHPDAQIEDNSSSQGTARMLVKGNYAKVAQATFSLVIFIAMAYLIAMLLSFMDKRKTFAILKSIGLKNNEVACFIACEALIAPLAGVFLGVGIGATILKILAFNGTGLNFSLSIASSACLAVVPALLIGTLVPSRLAQIATVVALLFQRGIPLYVDRIKTVGKRFPQLEKHIAQGVHFLKLDAAEDSIVFRRLGSTVKKGEVIACSTAWWGLVIREFIAPIDGTVVYFQVDTGFVGIGPAELLGCGAR